MEQAEGEGPVFCLNRFGKFETSAKSWTYSRRNDKADRISFKVNRDISIHAVGLYGKAGPSSPSVDYSVDLQIYAHSRHQSVYGTATHVQGPPGSVHVNPNNGNEFRVTFGESVPIVPDTWYTISAVIMGGYKDRSYYGVEGKHKVTADCEGKEVVVEFQDAIDRKPSEFKSERLPSNGTGVDRGQIPCLYFVVPEEEDVEILDERVTGD